MMERLTYRDANGECWYCGNATPADRLHRLAAYEDTRLEPREVLGLCEMDSRARLANLLRLEEYQELGTIDHLRELVQAEQDGRLVVLPPPAKEGDPRPECFYNDCHGLWCLGCCSEVDDEPTDRCKQCWYCEGGDYDDDCVDAEAALEARKGGGEDDA